MAALAFALVLHWRVFEKEAILLTATECTVALPPALHEARKAGRLEGSLGTIVPAALFLAFAGRCCISAAVIVPTARSVAKDVAHLAAGKASPPGLALARVSIWASALGLGGLNALWFSKVVRGIAKVHGRQRAARAPRRDSAAAH